jgi:hypothetical protein
LQNYDIETIFGIGLDGPPIPVESMSRPRLPKMSGVANESGPCRHFVLRVPYRIDGEIREREQATLTTHVLVQQVLLATAESF